MDKVKRNERIGAMIKILSNSPNKSFTLTHFSDLFGSAKSTISEDVLKTSTIVVDKYPQRELFMLHWMAPAGKDISGLYKVTFSASTARYYYRRAKKDK
jgi:hypothetical protein